MIPLITLGITIASSYSVSIEPGPLLGTESFISVSTPKYFDMKFSLLISLPPCVFPFAVATVILIFLKSSFKLHYNL